ncbi:hypothetical protein GDO86_019432, partial [Hymenochirus boettgeri]
GFTALHLAACHGRLPCIKLLVEEYKVNVNISSHYGWTPLHLALNPKSGPHALECVKYLKECGANINARTKSGLTPLHQAAKEGRQDCVVVLVEAGADVHATDSQGQTPLDLCKIWAHKACARYLRYKMWEKDKGDFAREMNKMDKLKQAILASEQDTYSKVKKDQTLVQHLHFCDWLDKKGLPERLKDLSCVREDVSSLSRQCESIDKLSQTKIETSGMPTPKALCHDKLKDKSNISQTDTESKYSHSKKRPVRWNTSVNPLSPPITAISRDVQGILDAPPKEGDIRSLVHITKDEDGHPMINTISGKNVTSLPNLPYEIIERKLFPNKIVHDRLLSPRDFKSTHILDVQRKLPPSKAQRPASEIPYHLRQEIDPNYIKITNDFPLTRP